MHTKEKLRETVIAILKQLTPQADGKAPAFADKTRPIADLGLDSLTGLEFTVELSRQLQIAVPDDDNLFVALKKSGPETIGAIVNRLDVLQKENGSPSDGTT